MSKLHVHYNVCRTLVLVSALLQSVQYPTFGVRHRLSTTDMLLHLAQGVRHPRVFEKRKSTNRD